MIKDGKDTAATLDTSSVSLDADIETNPIGGIDEDDNIIHDKPDDVVINSTEVGR